MYSVLRNEDYPWILYFVRIFWISEGKIRRWTKAAQRATPPEIQQPTENAIGPMPTSDPVIKRHRANVQNRMVQTRQNYPIQRFPSPSVRTARLKPTTENYEITGNPESGHVRNPQSAETE
jgi:hypothetical protein